LNPEQQLAYLKQCVPEEAKIMLFINSIETVEEAFPVLADLFKHPEMYGVD